MMSWCHVVVLRKTRLGDTFWVLCDSMYFCIVFYCISTLLDYWWINVYILSRSYHVRWGSGSAGPLHPILITGNRVTVDTTIDLGLVSLKFDKKQSAYWKWLDSDKYAIAQIGSNLSNGHWATPPGIKHASILLPNFHLFFLQHNSHQTT